MPLGEVGIFQLINALQTVIKRVEAREDLQQLFGEHYTVSDKIESILRQIAGGVTLKFSELFAQMASRVEIVVTFLALLELIRLKQVRATQNNPFEEIVPLPLISYSGSFVLMIMFGLGIINSVWIHRKEIVERS